MAETLVEIVARAIWWGESENGLADDEDKCDLEWDEVEAPARYAAAALAALRDPPPAVIEAGAKAVWIEIDSATGGAAAWVAIDQAERNYWMHAWLASWRAAINVR